MNALMLRRPARGSGSLLVAALLLVLLAPGVARAQAAPASPDAGKKSTTTTGSTAAPLPPTVDVPGEIDIASLVTSAAKGVTTVQEAPSIITVITAEEIRQRGWRTLTQILGSIPGWTEANAEGNQVVIPLVRGTPQAALYLRDGVSMFDPAFNIATFSRATPVESIKRVEVVTGPGGVLWGANSFLGIVNVITKDAEDVNGLEISAGYGDGPGDAQDFRAYAMFGKSFWKNRLKVFLHASYENYLGQQATLQQEIASSPAPQPVGPVIYGQGLTSSDIARSWVLNLDGKVSLGPVTLYVNIPFGEMNYALAFGPPVVRGSLNSMGQLFPASDRSTWNFYDRYGVLEYKDRFFKDRLGVNVKGYYIQFVRDISPRVYPDSTLLPGGLAFSVTDGYTQRGGGTLDLDLAGPFSFTRILGGAEFFYESTKEAHATFPEPTDGNLNPANNELPIVCPRTADGKTFIANCPVFIYPAERYVAGLFIDLQLRPHKTLTLDAGARYQQGFGQRGYAPQGIYSAAAVWQFLPDFHLKLNFSQGFRAPVFNDTDGNGAAVQFGGNPKLDVERSEAYQGELNARLLRNVRKVRELQLRLDYAYTLLDNLIIVTNGLYRNSGRRAIQSVEFLGKLYLQGDHALTLGYSFLEISTSDLGELRSIPRHSVQIGAIFNLIKNTLDVNTNLNVYSAVEDPNRYPAGAYTLPGGTPAYQAQLSDFTYDRLTPVAQLQVGARLRLWREHIAASVQVFNVLNQHYYYPDVFFDQSPTLEIRPNPAPGISFFASLTYRP